MVSQMKTIARFSSTGAKLAKGGVTALLLTVWIAVAAPAAAQDYSSGQDAYANRDWDAALRIWTEEASAGSAEAMLGLGNLMDFGLAGPADPVAAFDLYSQAALLGNAEAGFNVAVMLDSGVGTTTDKRAAAGWYSLAALDDFPRAQYNLGQMYALGDGVPVNSQLAALWLGKAVPAIPPSQDLIDTLNRTDGTDLSAPDILQIVMLVDDEAPQARLAWASGAGPEGSRYRIEVADGAAAPGARAVTTTETTASAVSIPLPSLPEQAVVRVFQLTDLDYAVSSWTGTDGEIVDMDPLATVRFQIASDDRRGLGYAERMGSSLQRSGITVAYDIADGSAENSAVFYGYDSDAGLATNVAEFLPGVAGGGANRRSDLGLAPGEVLVRIVFLSEG